jgi:phosphoglycerate-specific signal transduction histidine kinase
MDVAEGHRADLRADLGGSRPDLHHLILRNELSRVGKVLRALSTAMGEQSDLKRRVNDLEEEVTDLTMRG